MELPEYYRCVVDEEKNYSSDDKDILGKSEENQGTVPALWAGLFILFHPVLSPAMSEVNNQNQLN